MIETKTYDELIEDLNEVFQNADGEWLSKLASEILVKDVKYINDSLFEVDDGD